ncbi:Aste57867_18188 [Aphanomyces stellatus]|uniref:Magnesium transporter n=1 Tax=Aphanomyces stellatus TaxID=120398 RepID=A0A485LA27_9STRA|nr:hypothetical protein As57867_018126 [Aphanomyces stellatus]VFT94926.1 Aste57867_18188 [Aphanomyces stellatus]
MATAGSLSPFKTAASGENSPWVQVHQKTLREVVTVDMLPVRPNPLTRDSQDSFSKTGLQDVLKFDMEGSATMLRMRRADVLKMTQQAALQAASPKSDTIHENDIPSSADATSARPPRASILRFGHILFGIPDPIRSVIMRECCLMFVPDTNHALVGLLKEKFKEPPADEDSEMPFEFRALEAILSTVCKCVEHSIVVICFVVQAWDRRFLSDDFNRMAPIVNASLERLASAQMSSGELETLRTLKNAMNEFESQVNGLRRVLMEILDNEVDLHLLYLTQLFLNPISLNDLWNFDAEEAEALLEAYLQDIHSTKTKVALMLHRIQNTESVVMLKMDAVRNYLLTADMMFTLVMVCLTFGMFVTAAFGMNLTSGLEQTPGAFLIVVVVTVVSALITVYLGIVFFRQRGVII